MRTTWPMLMLMFIALAGAGPASDRGRMQGLWRITGGERDGKPIPADEFKGRTIEIKGDKWLAHRPDRPEPEVASVKLDEAKTPRQIDLTGPYVGPGPGRKHDVTILGIYELKGNVLRVCFAGPGEEQRPTEFKSVEGKAGILIFERVRQAKDR